MTPRNRWLLLSLLCASPAVAADLEREVTAGVSTFSYTSFLRRGLPLTGGEVAYNQQLGTEGFWRSAYVTVGLRAAPVPALMPIKVPLEGFAQLQLRTRIGFWELGVGPELGVSGYSVVLTRPIPAEGQDADEEERFSPVYLAFGATPARFHIGRFVISAGEFHIGASAWPRASLVRTYFSFVRIGVSL